MSTQPGKAAAKPAGAKGTAKAASKRGPAKMSSDHKEALATGRKEATTVKRYLDALEAHRPKRGRKVSEETLKARLAQVEVEIASAKGLDRVLLSQQRLDLVERIDATEQVVDISALQAEFVKVAKSYSARRGLTYTAWRSAGISAEVLKAAGIKRTSERIAA